VREREGGEDAEEYRLTKLSFRGGGMEKKKTDAILNRRHLFYVNSHCPRVDVDSDTHSDKSNTLHQLGHVQHQEQAIVHQQEQEHQITMSEDLSNTTPAGDPLEESEDLEDEPKNVLFGMIKYCTHFCLCSAKNKAILYRQLRVGMDLHRITFPTFVLEPRSMLERITDFMAHQDLVMK